MVERTLQPKTYAVEKDNGIFVHFLDFELEEDFDIFLEFLSSKLNVDPKVSCHGPYSTTSVISLPKGQVTVACDNMIGCYLRFDSNAKVLADEVVSKCYS